MKLLLLKELDDVGCKTCRWSTCSIAPSPALKQGGAWGVEGIGYMAKKYLVTLGDVTQSRATVTAVRETDDRGPITVQDYSIVEDPDLVPIVGERVWIKPSINSRGYREITGRQ